MNSKQNIINEICTIFNDVSSQQRHSFKEENRILVLCCQKPQEEPRKIASQYMSLYGLYRRKELTGHGVIDTFQKCFMANVPERKELFERAKDYALNLQDFINGKGNINDLNNIVEHVQFKRLVLIMFAETVADIKNNATAYEKAIRLNKDFAREAFDDLVAYLQKMGKKIKHVPLEQELRNEIDRLNNSLVRTKQLLKDLQESFDTQLETSIEDEQERLISMLNSDKYGYILDLLMSSKSGFASMRRKKIAVPMEIKNIQTLVRRLLEFVEDYGVTPMIEVGEKLKVNAEDIADYIFEGSSFSHKDEVQDVEVVSPGWEIVRRNIIISAPRLREIKED